MFIFILLQQQNIVNLTLQISNGNNIYFLFCYILLQPQNVLKSRKMFFFFFFFFFITTTKHNIAIISDASK